MRVACIFKNSVKSLRAAARKGPTMIKKIVSGGQSGVDRAALDAALENGFPLGGWCPKGRPAEDGPIDEKYPLKQTPSEAYSQRTQWNVRDSDGTLILARGDISGGTAFTAQAAKKLHKPHMIMDLRQGQDLSKVKRWIADNKIAVLNIAGPRASKEPKVYLEALAFLRHLFKNS